MSVKGSFADVQRPGVNDKDFSYPRGKDISKRDPGQGPDPEDRPPE